MDSEVSFFITFESKEEAGGNVYFLIYREKALADALIKSGITYQRISLIRAGALTMALFTYI